MLDLGCGTGSWGRAALELGINNVVGVDGFYVDQNTLAIPRNCFIAHDLDDEGILKLNKKFDLVISLEVAEHLKPSSADNFVQNLVTYGDVILFSAAIQGQGGTNHINEQHPDYWIKKFKAKNYKCYDVIRPIIWNDRRIEWWYRQNAFIFINENSSLASLKYTLSSMQSFNEALRIHPRI